MKDAIEKAMKIIITEKIVAVITSDEALKLTQATLNLAHVLAVRNQIENPR